MGHASLRTTVVYAEVSGAEEMEFARRMWSKNDVGACIVDGEGSQADVV